jgi:CheY-like chemotaxis protein
MIPSYIKKVLVASDQQDEARALVDFFAEKDIDAGLCSHVNAAALLAEMLYDALIVHKPRADLQYLKVLAAAGIAAGQTEVMGVAKIDGIIWDNKNRLLIEGHSKTFLVPQTGVAGLMREMGKEATRVLLVEDNDINAMLAEKMLKVHSCHTRRVRDGAEAVMTASMEPDYNLILMDIHMPRMDGLAATAEIRQVLTEQGRNVPPIVAVSAGFYDEDRKKYLAAGLDDFIAKPFSSEQLAKTLAKWSG